MLTQVRLWAEGVTWSQTWQSKSSPSLGGRLSEQAESSGQA